MRLIVIGEILWDLVGSQEHLGGAPFNFTVQASRLGYEVTFISAVGDDRRGLAARQSTSELGISTRFLQSVPGRRTGTVTVSVAPDGQPTYMIHRPAAYDFARPSEADFLEIASQGSKWIYYGTLHSMDLGVRRVLKRLLDDNPGAWRFYDVNLRKDSFSPSLVVELLAEADVVKLNESEVDSVQQIVGTCYASIEAFCREYAARFDWWSVCVTRGERGCALLVNGQYVEVEGYSVLVADSIGAGDAFSAALIHGLNEGWSLEQIGDFANRIGAIVASLPGAVAEWSPGEITMLSRSKDPATNAVECKDRH